MKVKLILFSIAITASFATYAAAGSSLWGEVDQPLKTPQQELQEQKAQDAAAAAAAAAAPPEVQQKTVCEILTAQASLDVKGLNTADSLGRLRTAIDAMPDEFKILMANNDAMNKLYQAYRAKYLKTYCTK